MSAFDKWVKTTASRATDIIKDVKSDKPHSVVEASADLIYFIFRLLGLNTNFYTVFTKKVLF